MKAEEKAQARRLRENGESVRDIAKEVGVSRGTVSLWVRDIQLTDRQRSDLSARRGGAERAGEKAKVRGLKRREELQEEGRVIAKKFMRDPEFVVGCALYWAEGAKGRGELGMSSSDPVMLRVFVDFCRKYFSISDETFSVFCRYYTDLTTEGRPEIEWLRLLGLPEKCLRKSCVDYYPKDTTVVKRRYSHGKLEFGTCRVKIHDVEAKQRLYGAIQEACGISKPEWLG